MMNTPHIPVCFPLFEHTQAFPNTAEYTANKIYGINIQRTGKPEHQPRGHDQICRGFMSGMLSREDRLFLVQRSAHWSAFWYLNLSKRLKIVSPEQNSR